MADYKYWLPDDAGQREINTFANSVIFIGANGAGKSRLGAWIERKDTEYVHRIGAQRNLNYQENIPLRSYKESEDLVLFGNSDLPNRERKHFKYQGNGSEDDRYVIHLFDDFTNVLSALIAKSNNENDKFIAECKKAEKAKAAHPHTPKTDIDKLVTVWSDIFPQRTLIYNDSRFYAEDPISDKKGEYSATKMSDGERTALYFIAQVLTVPPNKALLIDEPELHLHKSLMNRLWLALEKYRPDCLFIYITHDTQFAALHLNADKYWVKSYSGNNNWEIEKIESRDFPEDLLLDLLGNRKNVLFVEGTSGSYDTQLYSLIYKDYYIVPCGSCTQVIARTKAFNNTTLLHHYMAYGLIDRDYRSDYEIESYKKDNIFTIEVAEIENLFVTEDLIKAIAKLHGADENEVFQKVYTYIVKERFEKQIDAQVCQAVVSEIKYRLNVIEIDKKNEIDAKAALKRGLDTINYEEIKQEIENRFINVQKSGDFSNIIKVFNEKGLSKSVGHFMGIVDKDYCQIIIGMLKNGKIDVESIFDKYLPKVELIPRTLTESKSDKIGENISAEATLKG